MGQLLQLEAEETHLFLWEVMGAEKKAALSAIYQSIPLKSKY